MIWRQAGREGRGKAIHTIAIAGKGGTGKTTLCGLLIDYLCKNGGSPVLAVDADPSSNLNEVLGVKAGITLGEIRDTVATADQNPDSPIPAGLSKHEYMDYKFSAALAEEDDFDLLVMGRTQGKGCYCFVNGLLQSQISKFAGRYKYVVVDNEAGMEHISRGLLPQVDTVLLVSDCSQRGVEAAIRIAELIGEVGVKPKAVKLIVNRAPEGGPAQGVLDKIAASGLDLAGVVAQDPAVYEYDSEGLPTATIPLDSPARVAVGEIAKKLFG